MADGPLWWAAGGAALAMLVIGAGLPPSARAIAKRLAGGAARTVERRAGADPCDDAPACHRSAACGGSAADAGPDIHLVMNTFNRLAGEIRFDDAVSPNPLFVLSDYLRQCLVHVGPAQVALHEEIDMLESYLRLASAFHGLDLRASVELAPGGGDVRVQAHSICLVAQVLLGGLNADSTGRFVLPVRVRGLPTGGVDVDMALRLEPRPANTRLRRMREELKRTGALMSRRSVCWTCQVVRDHRSDIAVSLRIRPCPAQ